MENLTNEEKQVLIHLLNKTIHSLHDSLCLEDIGDEAAYILSSRYRELLNIQKKIEGEDDEKN